MHTRRLDSEVQEAHQQVAELNAMRREYQHTIDAYEDLYNRYRNEFNLHRMCKYTPMRLEIYNKIIKRSTNYHMHLDQS